MCAFFGLAVWQVHAAASDDLLWRDIQPVYAASGFNQPASDAPASVSVITAADIERFGWRTLAEALGAQRGFYTHDDWAYQYVGVRGVLRAGDWNSRILLLVDGQRINDNVYGQAMLGQDAAIDLRGVERIEVIRGPGSSLYGTSAVYAVVNVVTQRGRDLRGVRAEALVGSQRTREIRLAAGDRREDIEYAVSLSRRESRGAREVVFPELAATTPTAGVSTGADGGHVTRFLANLRWRGFGLQAGHADWYKVVPTGAYGTALSDPRHAYAQQRSWLRLGWEADLAAATRVRLGWSINHFRYTGEYPLAAEGYVNHDVGEGAWQQAEAVIDHRLSPEARLTAGVDVQIDRRIHQYNADVAVNLDDTRKGRAQGAFVQLEQLLMPSLRINAGLRHDRYASFGGTTNPRVGLIWQPSPQHAWKLLYGTAFRAPNASERWYSDGGISQAANAGLGPERARSLEGVWEARWRDGLRTTVSLYRNALRGLIDTRVDTSTGLMQYVNAGRLVGTGLEAEVEARLAKALDARLALSWQHADDGDGGPALSSSPGRTLKGGLLWRVTAAGATLAVDARASSRVATLDGSTLPGFATADATLLWPLRGPAVRLAVSAHNLFDRAWRVPAGPEHLPQASLPQPGRSVAARLSIDW